jgi:hypothetical protein
MSFIISKDFSWEVERAISHYYRVQCVHESATSVVFTIAAIGINDLCKKLKKQSVDFSKIQRIDKYVKPVDEKQNGDTVPVSLPSINNCQSCCEFIESSKVITSSSSSSLAKSSLAKSSRIEAKSSLSSRVPSLKEEEITKVRNPFGTLLKKRLTDITFDEVILDEQVLLPVSEPQSVMPLPQVSQTIQVNCCGPLLPLVFEFTHNLNLIKPLSDFLQVNGLTLIGAVQQGIPTGSFIKLIYNANNADWEGSTYYTGQSPTGSYSESWNILCQFGCSNQNSWRFSLIISSVNVARRASARLLAFFDVKLVCPKSDTFFGFNFTLSPDSLKTTPKSQIILHDEYEFFSESQGNAESVFNFKIQPQDIETGSNQILVNLSPQYDATLFVPTGV